MKSATDLDISVVNVTPTLAKQWLGKNHNRKLRKSVVDAYAKQMASGQWSQSHQGIAFSPTGELLDGQHRLAAVVQSGVPVSLVVVRGVRQESQLNMDIGLRRNVVDSALLATGRHLCDHDVAAIKAWERVYRTRSSLSNADVLEIYDRMGEGLAWLDKIAPPKAGGFRYAPARAAFGIAYFYVRSLPRFQRCVEIVANGDSPNGDKDSAAMRIREAGLERTVGDAQRKQLFMRVCRGIEAFQIEAPLKILRAPETCPFAYPLNNNIRGPGVLPEKRHTGL